MFARDDEIQTLVEQLSARLGRSVLVDDASLRLLAYSPALGDEDEARRTAILTRETPRAIREIHLAEGIASATSAMRTARRAEYSLEARVCVSIRCQGDLFGYLWLIDADESLTEEECALASACAAEVGAAMYRHQELEKPRRESERQLIEALLDGDDGQRRDAARDLVGDGMIIAGAGVAALVVSTSDDPSAKLDAVEQARVSLALDQFRRALPTRQALSIVRPRHGFLLVAIGTAMQGAGGLRDLACRLAESLKATVSGGPTRVTVGYSDERGHLSDAHSAYEHARLAQRVATYVPTFKGLAGWSELGAYGMLARLAEEPEPEALLHQGLRALLELPANESLVITLEAYLDYGCNTKLTAEALFVHRASLYYRLQRIEAITQTSLTSGADRLALHAGLKLSWLLGIHPAQRAR